MTNITTIVAKLTFIKMIEQTYINNMIIDGNASNNTSSYTHVSSYMV